MLSYVKEFESQANREPSRASNGRKRWLMLVAAMMALPTPSWAQFKEPYMLREITAGRRHDWAPTLSSDMLEIYWQADQPRGPGIQNARDIWWTRRESIDAPWEDPQLLDVVNTARVDSNAHLSYDGLTLTFASDGREGGYGGLDLWQTTRASRDAPWQEPVNMGPTINTRRNEGSASFSPDGLEIIFNSGCPGGPCSPSSLRRSTRETLTDEWTSPEGMTPSERGDQLSVGAYPFLSPDGLSLYYSKPGSYGGLDVFVSERPSLDAVFGGGENLGATINSSGNDAYARLASDGSLYYGYNWTGGSARIWRAEPEDTVQLLGDFDSSGVLDISDIDNLLLQVAAGENPSAYDLNNDANVDTEDIRVWVKDLANTWIGDANLDGEFNSGDMVQVFQAGKYESDLDAGWAEGDWTGDRRFDSGDMVAAFQDAGYEMGPRPAVNAVPEPSSGILLAVGAFCICRMRSRKCRFAVVR